MSEASPSPAPTDAAVIIIEGLRDEVAFMALVEKYQVSMLRIAQLYVPSRAVAEEVVQEAWCAIVKGLHRFEGRSSLRTWMFRIVANIARTTARAEGRTVPFSALAGDDQPDTGVDPDWFQDASGRWPGGWRSFPDDWSGVPEARLEGKETLRRVRDAIDTLPPLQAEVIRLRDVHGWSADEVCHALDVSETYQRVLLHRARTRVRRDLHTYLSRGPEAE